MLFLLSLCKETHSSSRYKKELATFTHGKLVEPDLLPGEKGGEVRICCDKDPFSPPPANYTCDCNGAPYTSPPDCYGGAN